VIVVPLTAENVTVGIDKLALAMLLATYPITYITITL
jgi:hypothetical protein